MTTNNKFYINKNKQKLGIGTLNLTDDINIGSSIKITNDGTVKKILVENGMPVEFNQDLVVIE